MKLLYEHYCDTKDFIYIFNLNTRSSKIRIQAWTIFFSEEDFPQTDNAKYLQIYQWSSL